MNASACTYALLLTYPLLIVNLRVFLVILTNHFSVVKTVSGIHSPTKLKFRNGFLEIFGLPEMVSNSWKSRFFQNPSGQNSLRFLVGQLLKIPDRFVTNGLHAMENYDLLSNTVKYKKSENNWKKL